MRHTHLIFGAALAGSLAACTDSRVPYFAAPTSVPTSTAGVQNAVTGVFSLLRNDQQNYLLMMSEFSRDAMNFLAEDPEYITDGGGLQVTANGDFTSAFVWSNEFTDVKEANATIATLPQVPAFTAPQAAAVTGVLQTMKALSFMYLAETRDTLGVPIYAVVAGLKSPPYCNVDVWKYIVTLLDSGNADLNTAGPVALPVTLPGGFASVGATAAPSTTQGSFASFNRALAAKAGLELAYAIARGSGAAPTPTSAGAPDMTALTRADSAMLASALYNPSVITPPPAGAYSLDPYGVYHTYSAQSGDQTNPENVFSVTMAILYDLQYDVDTLNDLRWLHKVSVNPVLPLQNSTDNPVATSYVYSSFLSPSSPEPIVRDEELTLVRAQIRLGLADYATAITLINDVHELAGGFATPLTIAPTYTAVRDSLMKEQRISTVLEGSEDRTIAIRMYGLQAVSDTTWQATSGPDAIAVANITGANKGTPPIDYHSTILQIPAAEISGRSGAYTLSCP